MAQVVAYIPMFHVPTPPSPTLGPWVATGGEGSEGATGGASVEAMDLIRGFYHAFYHWNLRENDQQTWCFDQTWSILMSKSEENHRKMVI